MNIKNNNNAKESPSNIPVLPLPCVPLPNSKFALYATCSVRFLANPLQEDQIRQDEYMIHKKSIQYIARQGTIHIPQLYKRHFSL